MDQFDPYHKWLGIPPDEQPPNHYRLLGLTLFESDPDVIDAATEQRVTFLRMCVTGQHVAESQKLLNEVAAARLCLLNAEKRRDYDQRLRQFLVQSQFVTDPAAPASAPLAMPWEGHPNEVVEESRFPDFRSATTIPEETPKTTRGALPVVTSTRIAVAVLLLIVVVVGIAITNGRGIHPKSTDDSSQSAPTAGDATVNQKKGWQEMPEPSPVAMQATDKSIKSSMATVDPEIVVSTPIPPTPTNSQNRNPGAEPTAEKAEKIDNTNVPKPPETKKLKHPIPDGNSRHVAAMRIRASFRTEQRKKTSAERLLLANELLKSVADEPNDPAAQYELLTQAKQLAVEVGDVGTASETMNELIRLFDVEDAKLRLDTISILAANAKLREQLLVFAVHAFALAENAIDDVDPETARKGLALGVGIAKRGNNPVLADYGNSRIKELAALSRNRIEQVREAKELLQRDPNNLGAISAAGEFLCLVSGDLVKGLPLLAKSSDPTLKSLAEKELANPAEVAQQIDLANGWWNLSEARSQPEKVQFQRLAKRWYLKALPRMPGIEQATFNKRIAQIPLQLGMVHCRAIVDGRDDLVFSATQIELRHHAWSIPSSVVLNSQHKWNPGVSVTFPNSGKSKFLAHTTDFSKCSIVKLRGRGSVRAVSSNESATIQLDDGDLGADVYEFVLIFGISS